MNENYEHFGNLTTFSSPMKYFKLFVNNELIDHITFQSNLYATQLSQQNCRRAFKSFTKSEIKSTIGIILLMGIYKLPNCRTYWAPYSKVSIIADTMPRNCFEEILRHLHYNDNSLDLNKNNPSHNKLFKIQPLIDHFCKAFQSAVLLETFMSVDEMMVTFKVRHSAKVYMPKKPTKVGYKMWYRNGISGYTYQFEYLEVKVYQVRQQIATPPAEARGK